MCPLGDANIFSKNERSLKILSGYVKSTHESAKMKMIYNKPFTVKVLCKK